MSEKAEEDDRVARLERAVGEVAARAGVPVPRVEITLSGDTEILPGRHPRLQVHGAVVAAPPAVRAAIVAHEIAHLKLGHGGARADRRRAAIVVGATVAVVGGVGLAALVSPLFWLLALVSLPWMMAAIRWDGRVRRPQELAADRVAVELMGGDAGPSLAALDWSEEQEDPISRMARWVKAWASTHPTYAERRAALRVPEQPG